MLDQNYVGNYPLPPGGQRVRMNDGERGALWVRAIGFGVACLGLLIGLALPLAVVSLPLWAALLLVVAAALPGWLAQRRLLALADDLRAGTAVLQTARLEGLRKARRAGERCHAAFAGVGEFSLDAAAYQQLRRRIGRRYRVVYAAHSRTLLAIEPVE
jgi:hypothetical protein